MTQRLRKGRAAGRSITEVIGLLSDHEFCNEAKPVIDALAVLRARDLTPRQWQREAKLVLPFLKRWGVVPTTTSELLDPDGRRRLLDVLVSGRWGLVPIFPSTTDAEITKRLRAIRSVVPRQHKDALNVRNPQLSGWLELCGFKRPEIARAILERTAGLRRLTKAEAIARTPWERETALLKRYKNLGLTESQAEQRVYRRLRGSEASASATIRMAERRYTKAIEKLNEDLLTPRRADDLSHPLTMLLQALAHGDDAALRQHAMAAQIACVRAAAPASVNTGGEDEALPTLPQVVVSGHWALVPVFPWTTGVEMRASVRAAHALVARPVVDNSVRDTPDPPPLTRCLSELFQALPTSDDAVLRRHAGAVKASLLRSPCP